MPTSLIIRPYAAGDREAVRRICCDTADAGHPVESFFSDRELIADLLMNYYTDYEPESVWVAEQAAGPVITGGPAIADEPAIAGEMVGSLTGCCDTCRPGTLTRRYYGEVVGYLTGCRDTERFRRIMFWRIVTPALFKALLRGTWWAASTRRLIRWNLPIWWRSLWHRAMPLVGYPAHLHINLCTGMQGQGIGRRLINQFLSQLRAAGIPGVHLSTRADNITALAFFEKMGFTRFERRPFMRISPGADDMRYSVIMVKKLE